MFETCCNPSSPAPERSDYRQVLLRGRLAQIPGAEITVREFENGPGVQAPIEIRLTGPDLTRLAALAAASRAAAVALMRAYTASSRGSMAETASTLAVPRVRTSTP